MGEQLERTIEVVGELREVLIEGRTLLKDMRQERKKLERVMKQAETHVHDVTKEHVDSVVAKIVEETIIQLGAEVRAVQEHMGMEVIKAFGDLTNNLMYGNSQGRGINILEQLIETNLEEQRRKHNGG